MPDQAVSDRELEVLGLIENVRSRRPKFRDAQITMAHGAGGKATQSMIEGLFVPAFLRRAGRAAAARALGAAVEWKVADAHLSEAEQTRMRRLAERHAQS